MRQARALLLRLRILLGRLFRPERSMGELDARTVSDVGLEIWRGPLGARAELGRSGLERMNSLV